MIMENLEITSSVGAKFSAKDITKLHALAIQAKK